MHVCVFDVNIVPVYKYIHTCMQNYRSERSKVIQDVIRENGEIY